jgi:hypothetical protein
MSVYDAPVIVTVAHHYYTVSHVRVSVLLSLLIALL